MKLLYTLLFAFSFSTFAYSDEIHMTVKSLFTSYDKILDDIEIESITESTIYFHNRDGMKKRISCSVVNEIIIDHNGQHTIYEFDCTKNNNRLMIINELFGDEISSNKDGFIQSSEQTESMIYQPKVKNIKRGRGRLGGALIAVGGIFLFSNIDKEPNNDETLEEFYDRFNSTQKIGYGLIIIGGFLVAVGI